MFLDKDTRQCSVYEHRPNVCRRFPGRDECKWEDRRIAESEAAGYPVVILTQMPGLLP